MFLTICYWRVFKFDSNTVSGDEEELDVDEEQMRVENVLEIRVGESEI